MRALSGDQLKRSTTTSRSPVEHDGTADDTSGLIASRLERAGVAALGEGATGGAINYVTKTARTSGAIVNEAITSFDLLSRISRDMARAAAR